MFKMYYSDSVFVQLLLHLDTITMSKSLNIIIQRSQYLLKLCFSRTITFSVYLCQVAYSNGMTDKNISSGTVRLPTTLILADNLVTILNEPAIKESGENRKPHLN